MPIYVVIKKLCTVTSEHTEIVSGYFEDHEEAGKFAAVLRFAFEISGEPKNYDSYDFSVIEIKKETRELF